MISMSENNFIQCWKNFGSENMLHFLFKDLTISLNLNQLIGHYNQYQKKYQEEIQGKKYSNNLIHRQMN
jgi:hypothetical protein